MKPRRNHKQIQTGSEASEPLALKYEGLLAISVRFRRWRHTHKFRFNFIFEFTTGTESATTFPADLVANGDEICGERYTPFKPAGKIIIKIANESVGKPPSSESDTFAQKSPGLESQQIAALPTIT